MSYFDPAPYVARLTASRDFCQERIGHCAEEIVDAMEDGSDLAETIKTFLHREAVLVIGECINAKAAEKVCVAHEQFDGPSAETAVHFNAIVRAAA